MLVQRGPLHQTMVVDLTTCLITEQQIDMVFLTTTPNIVAQTINVGEAGYTPTGVDIVPGYVEAGRARMSYFAAGRTAFSLLQALVTAGALNEAQLQDAVKAMLRQANIHSPEQV